MEGAISTLVQELAKLGPSALPWIVVVIVVGTAFVLIKWLVNELLKLQGIVIAMMKESSQADKDQAIEYRRLVDVVQGRRPQ